MHYFVFTISVITAIGIVFQCLANLKVRRAEFMAFPISLLLLFPYPLWAWFSWRVGEHNLLTISFIMGIPSAWLALQYFQFEWPRRKGPLSIEDRMTIALTIAGALMMIAIATVDSVNSALAITAAYYTCCISMFSYLVKIWRVYKGSENLEGLKWSTMILLLIFYCCMIYVGQEGQVGALSAAYVFSVFACSLAIAYKAFHERTPKTS